jgi:hypothetical protein
MIADEWGLANARSQLALAEAALEDLHREVFPKNERNYRVMAEAYVEVILKLRREIDGFLKVDEIAADADLMIALEGKDVGLGTTSAAVVTKVIDDFRRGLQAAVVVVQEQSRETGARRRGAAIERLCDVSFAGALAGSVRILLNEPKTSGGLFVAEDVEAFHGAVDMLFDAIAWAGEESGAFPDRGLSVRDQQILLNVVSRLAPSRSGPVERIGFTRRVALVRNKTMHAELAHSARGKIRAELKRLSSSHKYVALAGVIRSVDLDKRTFELRNRPNGDRDLPCEYGPESEPSVKEFLDRKVTVTGTLETSAKTAMQNLRVDDVEADESDVDEVASE